MFKNFLKKKKEIDANKKYIDTKRKEIHLKKQLIQGDMDRWGKKQNQKKNFP